MKLKHFVIIALFFAALFLLFLWAAITNAAPVPTWQVVLKDNQTVQVHCTGDELIVTPYNDTEMEITCRTWLR